MAKNDYFVIVYKILSYLYECMKAGKEPAQEDIACDSQLFHISQRYWNHMSGMQFLEENSMMHKVKNSWGKGLNNHWNP